MENTERHAEFLRLFVRHEPRIYGFIRSIVCNRDDAEDVFQDVAVVLWDRFSTFQTGTRFDSWALTIAHNQLLSFLQRRKRNRIQFDVELIAKLAEDGGNLSDFGKREVLQDCLDKLSTDERQLISLRFDNESTNRSVANQLGWTESSVSRTLSRLYIALLRCIEFKQRGGERT